MAPDRRAINAYRRRAFGSSEERSIAFVCECADADCRRAVLLTAAEYDHAVAAARPILADRSHLPPGSVHSLRNDA